MRIAKKTLVTVALVVVAASSLNGGVRAPRKYHGVVLFDRWDGCYLASGPYLMYFSKNVKEKLRTYDGKSTVVEAKNISQPMNPGDGLITNIGSIHIDSTHDPYTPVEALTFKLSYDPSRDLVALDVINSGTSEAEFSPVDLGIHALTKSNHKWPDPSDDTSTAYYTRQSLKPYFEVGAEPREVVVRSPKLENSMKISPGGTLSIALQIHFPPGQYDMFVSYGGGVHESKSVASEMLALDFDAEGKITSAYQHMN